MGIFALTLLIENRVSKPFTDATVFPILCDWIKTPGSLVISLGDIIINIGCLVFFYLVIKGLILKYKQKRS